MHVQRRLIAALVLVVVFGGCSDTTQVADVGEPLTTLVSVVEPVPEAGGPCVDENHNYVRQPGTGIKLSNSELVVRASFGSDRVGFCPGHPEHGNDRGTHSDGFLAGLESTLIQVDPGAELTLTAIGYPGATIDLQWSIRAVMDSSFPATPTPVDDEATWTVNAPSDADVFSLSIRLDWFEGEASYGALVATRDLPPEGESLVSIEPVGSVAMHPTLVPFGYVDCGTTDEVVRICDPEREQRWIEVATQEGPTRPEWAWNRADDRLPGVIQMSEGPPIFAVYAGPDTFITFTASGLDWEEQIAVVGSIPAFDSTERKGECEATPAEQLPDTWWKCDLVVEMPDATEAGLKALVEAIDGTPIGYSFTPVLPSRSGLTARPIVTYGSEGPWGALQEWKDQMASAAEELGLDVTPLAEGTYLIDDVLLIYRNETPRDEYLKLLERLSDNGFTTQMILRERFGHP